ncbi:MAG TPA: Ig-like domain-containing protein [Mucilaginibacter sp.]|nr:Ig-like domain-containing protein [Mucilaginibacter sp.]
MNLRKFLLALSIPVFFASIQASAQRDSIPLTTIIAKTMNYTSGHPTEKVYLQFDKPYYAVHDTIRLKAYVTTDLHVPSQLSKIVYVDLINGQNVIIDELKLHLVNGMAEGSEILNPAYYRRGSYLVRAYTKWMRNFDQAYFFNKTISVGSIDDGQVISTVSFKNNISDKEDKINADVVYKDQNGNPYAGKKVTWKVMNDDQTISKGRGETDKNGVLNISFSTDKTDAVSSAMINTDLSVSETQTVTRIMPLQTTPPGIDFQFFPEGGALIEGIRSRVAFKAVRPNGLSIEAKGKVVDNTGKEIASFGSQHLGMGVFAIMPENNKTYKANVTFADGSSASYDLPDVRAEGINLSVNNSNPDTLSLRITANNLYLQRNQNRAIYVMAQSNGTVCYAAQTILKETTYSANIPKSKFPTGIVQVTIFSSKGSPLSERIAFIRHPDDLLKLSMRSDKQTYNRRQKVRMSVSAKNKSLPDMGNFSVAVINENEVPFDDDAETTILSHLLLTSDLRGYIEKPNYYFNHHDEQAISDLDVLMLTQGYRRFSYRSIISDRISPTPFAPEQGIEISGTLRTNTGLPVAKGNVRMFIADKNFSTQTTTDMSGNFVFPDVNVADSSKVVLNARDNPNGTNLVLTLNQIPGPPSTQYINMVSGITNIDSVLRPYLAMSKKQFNLPHALTGVVIKAEKNERRPGHLDYPALTGLPLDADHTIPGNRFADCLNFPQCLAAASLGLTFDSDNLYITRDYMQGGRIPVQVCVNGMVVDFPYLNNVQGSNVESVEIFFTDGFSGLNRGSNTKGVLEVNLKKAPKGEKISKEQLMEMLPKPYVLEFTPGGYNVARTFYMPKYDNPASANAGVDFRSTIYWNANVTTDKNGAASFEFFNSDGIGTYKAIIEGIDKDGNLGRYVYRYNVQ